MKATLSPAACRILTRFFTGYFTATQQVENSESTAASYINFSAFLARLLVGQVAEATRLSALIRPSVFATKTSQTYENYEPWASVAAQWILYSGDALYEMCDKETIIEIGKQKWTIALWNGWRPKFKVVAETERFSVKARTFASAALEKMAEVERNGVTTDVVANFGFTSMKD